MALRLAALCAEEGARHDVQHRLEAALALERFVMGGATGARPDAESPRELVDEAEHHLRALLRDVLCGYLDADLKGVADDILIESGTEPFMETDTQESEVQEIEARDLREEPRFERAEPQRYLDFDPDIDYDPAPDYEAELDAEPDTAELEAVTVAPESVSAAPEPEQHELDGVTHSADWGWDDPEDFSAPV
jgi:hypothetical protein